MWTDKMGDKLRKVAYGDETEIETYGVQWLK